MSTSPMDPIIALALSSNGDAEDHDSVMLVDTALKYTVMNTSPDNNMTYTGLNTLHNETNHTNFKQQYHTDIDE